MMPLRSGPVAILQLDPLPVGAARHVGDPLPVVQVPAHGLAQAAVEGLFRLPAELSTDLAGADAVELARTAALQHALDRRAMIRDVKPVADVPAIAIDRQRLARQRAMDH